MRIGILADIHEAVELLEVALGRLASGGVDRLVVLGDVFETGPRIDETVRLLEASGAVGVFGNHDYGLSHDQTPYIVDRFSPSSLAYMASLLPRMELGGCFFAHREPWLDCSDVAQVWHVDEEPLLQDSVARSFDAAAHASIFLGHYHEWRAFTRQGPLPWDGSGPLGLPAGTPAMVVVHAVCDGHAAIFDTETRVLTPVDLYEGRARPEHRPIPHLVDD